MDRIEQIFKMGARKASGGRKAPAKGRGADRERLHKTVPLRGRRRAIDRDAVWSLVAKAMAGRKGGAGR